MIKDYYIINKDTNRVMFRVTQDDSRINQLYPDDIVVEAGSDYVQVRPVYPGCLYHNDTFWEPIYGRDLMDSSIDYRMYRSLFTKNELKSIDCYYMDDSLTVDQKMDFKTILTTLQHLSYNLRHTDSLIDSLGLFLSVGYLSQERYDDIKQSLGVK